MITRPTAMLIALATLAVARPAQTQPLPTSSPTQAVGRYSVHGVVTDQAGDVLSDADVVVLIGERVVRRGRSDEAGRFDFDRLTDSVLTLRTRHVGFDPATTTIRFIDGDTATSLRIALDPVVAKLATTDVNAAAIGAGGKLRGFYDRAATNRFGQYFDRERIERSRRNRVSELLRGLPGVKIVAGELRIRGCRPGVWLDGVHLPDAEVDDVTVLENIAALEEYASWAGLPSQFQDRSNPCGALVVWTSDGGGAGS
jgi:hypothetical protein